MVRRGVGRRPRQRDPVELVGAPPGDGLLDRGRHVHVPTEHPRVEPPRRSARDVVGALALGERGEGDGTGAEQDVPAMIAATVGVARPRCRAASRVAIRTGTGRAPPSRPTRPRIAGTARRAPITRTTADPIRDPSTTQLSWVPDRASATAAKMPIPPRAAQTSPATGSHRRDGRGATSPRRADITSSRPSPRAGTSAATTAATIAQPRTTASWSQGTSNGPVTVVGRQRR